MITKTQLWAAVGVVLAGYGGLIALMAFGFTVLREDTRSLKTDLSADIRRLEASFDKMHPRIATTESK